MESSVPAARVLVVEHNAPVTQSLLEAVRRRTQRGSCSFTLLIPKPAHGLHKVVDPQDQSPAEAELEKALGPLKDAAGGMPVDGIVGDPDPVAAVEDAINLRGFDEVIVSNHPARLSRWLHLDLASKVSGMGLPVTAVEPSGEIAAADLGHAA